MATQKREPVIIRRWGKQNGGDLLLLFPYEPADNIGACCLSWEHVGQHGGANAGICQMKTKAVPYHVAWNAIADYCAEYGETIPEAFPHGFRIARKVPGDAYAVRCARLKEIAA